MGKSTERRDYLRELKTVSTLLARQESWNAYSPEDIFRAIVSMAIRYTCFLDDVIREDKKYGCPVRDEAFKELAVHIAYEGGTLREADKHLASKVLAYQQNPGHYPRAEGECYKHVRLLSEKRANQSDVECVILQQQFLRNKQDARLNGETAFMYLVGDEMKNALGFSVTSDSRIPEKLDYVPGSTTYTHGAHARLLAFRKMYPQSGAA